MDVRGSPGRIPRILVDEKPWAAEGDPGGTHQKREQKPFRGGERKNSVFDTPSVKVGQVGKYIHTPRG